MNPPGGAETNGPITRVLDGVRERLEAFDRSRRSVSASAAPGCSIFRFTGLDELLVSRLIAWLLTPQGSHAQGERFLMAFCRRFHATPPPLRRCRVDLEVQTHLIDRERRRIDICIRDEGWSLGIENKPVADFQRDQIADYLLQLERQSSGYYVLIVLKGWEGELPRDQLDGPGVAVALANGTLVNSDYAELQLWLEECASLAQAPYVRSLLMDLTASLQRLLSGGMELDRQNAAIEGILADDALRTASFELIASTDQLLAALSDRFVRDMRARLASTGFALVESQQTGRVDLAKKEFLDIELHPSLPFTFSVSFDKGNLRLPYFGLRPRNGGPAKGRAFTRLRDELAGVGLRSRSTYLEWWFWWAYASEERFGFSNDDTVAVWRSLGDQTFAETMAGVILEFADKLDVVGALDWVTFVRARR